MVINDLIKKGTDILKTLDFPRLEAEIFLSHILKKDRLFFAVHKDFEVDKNTEEEFLSLCKRRSTGEPSAYLVGEKEFMSLSFTVNKSVLIPRSETELTVEAIIDKYKNKKVNIMDICTGSGAIGSSLAYYIIDAFVTAVDISEDALSLAKENAQKLGVSKKISFIKEDALSLKERKEKFDIVVSNPPYIKSEIIKTLEKDVKDFEPILALDGGDDGLIFYRKIVDNIEKVLKPTGEIYFEIGFDQGEDVKDIMSVKFTDIKIVKDLAGLDRLISGQLR